MVIQVSSDFELYHSQFSDCLRNLYVLLGNEVTNTQLKACVERQGGQMVYVPFPSSLPLCRH